LNLRSIPGMATATNNSLYRDYICIKLEMAEQHAL